jgi:serine protease Do
MRIVKTAAVLVTLAGFGVLLLAVVPAVRAQSAPGPSSGTDRHLTTLTGLSDRWFGGSAIGVTARDLRPSDSAAKGEGVVIEEVRSDSPAARAGLKRSDIVVMFDGERVRSARQFARLVQETPAGHTVAAVVIRDGQRHELQITPAERQAADFGLDTDRLREHLGDLGQYAARLPPMDFNFDFETPGMRGRLGITTSELGDQLATYFGAPDGAVLVAAVRDGSPAAKAGVRAGDVITNVDGEPVRSRRQLERALDASHGRSPVKLGIIRDKKAITIPVGPDD